MKLIGIDIDGTILRKNGEYSPGTAEALRALEKEGHVVAIVTGRMYRTARKVVQQLGIDPPVVAYNGALIAERGQWERFIPLEPEMAREVMKWYFSFPGTSQLRLKTELLVFENDEFIATSDGPVTKRYSSRVGVEPVYEPEFFKRKKMACSKLLISSMPEDTEYIERVYGEMLQKFGKELYVTRSHLHFIEVMNPGATKGSGIKFLAQKHGIAPCDIVTIGDSENDIEMFEASGTSIAMGNAPVHVKNRATHITLTVDEGGVAYALTKLLNLIDVTGEAN